MLERLGVRRKGESSRLKKDEPAPVTLRRAVEFGMIHGVLTPEDKIAMLKEAYEIERQNSSANNSQ
jgi:hypothetical protein